MALVQSAEQLTPGASITVSFTNNIGAGNTVVVAVAGEASAVINAPTGTGDTYSTAVTAAQASRGKASLYYVLASAGGYKNISVTTSAGNVAAWAFESPPCTSLDKTSSGSNANLGWTSGSTAVTSKANEFWAGVVSDDLSPEPLITGPASPWVNLDQSSRSANPSGLAGYQFAASTATADYTGTGTNGYAACVATFVLAVQFPAPVSVRQAVKRASLW